MKFETFKFITAGVVWLTLFIALGFYVFGLDDWKDYSDCDKQGKYRPYTITESYERTFYDENVSKEVTKTFYVNSTANEVIKNASCDESKVYFISKGIMTIKDKDTGATLNDREPHKCWNSQISCEQIQMDVKQ